MRNATISSSDQRGAAHGAGHDLVRHDALTWLTTQLRWERMLSELRSQDEQQAQAA